MKKKILLTVSLVFLMVCLFVISVSAEVFNITYYEGGTQKETVQTDENGTITLRDTRYTDQNAPIFNWFTYEGDIYAPGETITVTKDTVIRQFCAYESTNMVTNHSTSQWGWRYIQLQEDLYLESTLYLNDGGRLYIDLNGYNIYSSATHVFEQRRAGLIIVGEGSIIHSGSGNIFNTSIHGYGDGNVCMIVGRDVTVTTVGNLYNYTNSLGSGHISSTVPFEVYGNITCNKLLNLNGTINESLGMVVDPVQLTITGDSLIAMKGFGDGGSVALTVGDGTFVVPEAASNESFWTGGFSDGFTVTVNGGNFTYGADVMLNYASGDASTITSTVGDASYSTIVSGACQHDYQIVSTKDATCVSLQCAEYQCTSCFDSYTVTTGVFAEHKYEMTAHIPATEVTSGEKTFTCSVCGKVYVQVYSFDPTELSISVRVNTENGEVIVSALVKDVFELTSVEELGTKTYTLVGLKDFGEYVIADILEVEVPVGIAEINFTQDNSTLKVLNILDNANLIVRNFSTFTALTDINIGKATVEFKNGCSNKVIQAIRSEVSGANVIFAANVFNGKSSLSVLTMSAYSDYDFGSNSFKQTSMVELIFPDYSRPVFRDDAAFYNCKVEYLYIGRGITTLSGKPFDYCQKMQTIILMDVKTITKEYTFCVENNGTRPVEVYIHSTEISLPQNTFYQCHGITVYTNAPITNTNAFNGCSARTVDGVEYPNYTIVYGIPHKYTEGSADATCTKDGSTGYVTDCPCGEVIEATYQTFVGCATTSETYTEGTIATSIIPKLGHEKGDIANVMFNNGYLSQGIAQYNCTRCFNTEGYYEEDVDAIISSLGYSTSEFNGNKSMSQGYHINTNVLDICKSVNSKYSYGLVAMGNLSGETQYPLTVKNGEVVSEGTALFHPIRTTIHDYFDIKITGLGDTTVEKDIIFCAYIFDGTNIYYVDNGESSKGVSGTSYSQLVSNVEETPSEDTENTEGTEETVPQE